MGQDRKSGRICRASLDATTMVVRVACCLISYCCVLLVVWFAILGIRYLPSGLHTAPRLPTYQVSGGLVVSPEKPLFI